MVNRYLLTDEVIKKYTKHNCLKFIISNLVVDTLFLIWCIWNYLSYKDNMFLYFILFVIFMIFLVFLKVHKGLNVEVERIRIRYGDEPQYMNIELRNEIFISVKDNTMNIPLDKVIKYTQNKEFIFVEIKGKMVVVLKKDSFVEGSYEDCIALLDGLIK